MFEAVAAFIVLGCILALTNNNRQLKQERGRRVVAEINARDLALAANGAEPYFACPACMAVSYSLADIEHGWCGRCRLVTGRPSEMERM